MSEPITYLHGAYCAGGKPCRGGVEKRNALILTMITMNRREAIQKAALTLGYAISASAALGVLQGCKAKPDLVYKPDFFTDDQALTISELAEIILPKTATPGAKDVGVPGFIDDLLKEVYTKEQQENFLKELSAFDEEAKKDYG